MLVTHPSPHPIAPTCPSTPKLLQTRECTPTPYPSAIPLESKLSLPKSLGVASLMLFLMRKQCLCPFLLCGFLNFNLKSYNFSSCNFNRVMLPLNSSFSSYDFLMNILIFCSTSSRFPHYAYTPFGSLFPHPIPLVNLPSPSPL